MTGSLRCRMKILILLLNVKEINRKEGRRESVSLSAAVYTFIDSSAAQWLRLCSAANGTSPLTLDSDARTLSVDSTLSKDNTRQRFPLTGRRRPC